MQIKVNRKYLNKNIKIKKGKEHEHNIRDL